jgi:hypothetical protein
MARLGPVILVVEDEFLLRMDSAEMIEMPGLKSSRQPMPMRPSRSRKSVPIFTLSSPISRCRVRWTG